MGQHFVFGVLLAGLLGCGVRTGLHGAAGPLSGASRPNVIWDEDTRSDVAVMDADRSLAQATALLFHKMRVQKSIFGTFFVPPQPLRSRFPLCENESFLNQDLLGHCSGVLIGPRWVLTAGHCVSEKKHCEDIYLTFGRTADKADTRRFQESDLYTCKRVIRYENSPRSDFGLIELDRDVTEVRPVKLGRADDLQKGDALISLSYPLGLPLKKDAAELIELEDRHFFRVKVDTFSGSSGSPLFNRDRELVGILASGSRDFNVEDDEIYQSHLAGTCIEPQKCDSANCYGERFLKIEAVNLEP